MSKKRVHEIAKEQGLSSKELLEKLKAAGVEAKAAASSVEEAVALKALGANGASGNGRGNGPAAAKSKGAAAVARPPVASAPRRQRPPLARTSPPHRRPGEHPLQRPQLSYASRLPRVTAPAAAPPNGSQLHARRASAAASGLAAAARRRSR